MLVTGDDTPQTLDGGAGDDQIYGLGGDDVLRGGDGRDLLDGGAGVDRMEGGAGSDVYVVDDAGDLVVEDADEGADTVRSRITEYTLLANLENLSFIGAGDFVGRGNAARNLLTGGAGQDRLHGEGGGDELRGGVGDDVLAGGAGIDRLDGGEGRDAADWSDATGGVVVDLVAGRGGNAADGVDLLFRIEDAIGGGFADRITGTAEDNRLSGLGGNDVLDAGAGADTVSGGAGDDLVRGSAGADALAGDEGIDTLSYEDAGRAMLINLAGGLAFDRFTPALDRDALSGFENVIGSAFGDLIVGTNGDNVLRGGGGNDVLYALPGADLLDGGEGNDAASFIFSPVGVTVNLGARGAQADGFGGTERLVSVEWVAGSRFNDRLIGYDTDPSDLFTFNLFVPGTGDDVVDGRGGFDIVSYEVDSGLGVTVNLATGNVTGSAGRDRLFNIEAVIGTPGADRLTGDAGVNYFEGREGADTLTGGASPDRFAYISAADSRRGSEATAGIDRITDFTADDQLDLSPVDADVSAPGDQAFRLVERFTGAAGELTLRYVARIDATTLEGDVDGDGVGDLVITFTGDVTALAEAPNFLF